jgi:translation elongation factor P/translation initiation factor 5A
MNDNKEIKNGSVVEFCGSPFTVVKINKTKLDIKQNFSLRIVYNDVSINDVKLIKNP